MFDTPVIIKQLNLNNKKLIDIAEYLEKTTKEKHHYSNRGGWQSNLVQNMEDLNDFKINILSILNENLTFAQIWFNINYKNNYNILHNHGPFKWSGNYYIKTHKNCGNLYLRDPRQGVVFSSLYGNPDKEIKINEGMVIIFPSYLEHYVGQNYSDEKRIGISFDLI